MPPPGPATEAAAAEEPLRERLWRQIQTGRLDEERLLPAVETRRRQLEKKLAKPLDANGWRKFVSGQAYAIGTGKAPQRRNAELMLVDTVARWRRDVTAARSDTEARALAWREWYGGKATTLFETVLRDAFAARNTGEPAE